MVCLFSAAEMREADRLAAESGVPGLRLMETAGRAVAEVAARLAQPGASITILAGKGNNGGDGLVAARYLAQRGLDVEVILAEPGETFTGDALANLQALVKGGFTRPRLFAGPPTDLSPRLAGSAVVIDALLGTGGKGAPRGPAGRALAAGPEKSVDDHGRAGQARAEICRRPGKEPWTGEASFDESLEVG